MVHITMLYPLHFLHYFLAGAFAAGTFGFAGAAFCGALASKGLKGAFGRGTFAGGGFVDPATDVALDPFFDGPSLGAGGLLALASFLRSNSAF